MNFINGELIMSTKTNCKPTMSVGDIYPSNHHGDMKVIEYISCMEVVVKFESGGVATAQADKIRKGNVKDPLMPSVQLNKVCAMPIHIQADRHSGVSGIIWNKSNSNWRLQLTIKGKLTYCGSFNSVAEAITHKAIVRLQELKRIRPKLSINAQIDRLLAE